MNTRHSTDNTATQQPHSRVILGLTIACLFVFGGFGADNVMATQDGGEFPTISTFDAGTVLPLPDHTFCANPGGERICVCCTKYGEQNYASDSALCALMGDYYVSGQSSVHITSSSYFHYASDLSFGQATDTGDLMDLTIERIHRLRDYGTAHASFGPGIYLNYDSSIQLFMEDATTPVADVFIAEANAIFKRRLRLGTDDFRDTEFRSYQKLVLYDTLGQSTTDITNASRAVLHTWKGYEYHFELIDIEPGLRDGRLTDVLDRDGYGIHLDYVYAVTDPLADPTERWKIDTIHDDHNREVKVDYTYDAGQWVISQITTHSQTLGQTTDLTESILYGYGPDGLASVTLQNGDMSTFNHSVTPNNQTKIAYSDAAAKGSHRRKDAYYSNATGGFDYSLGGVTPFSSASFLINFVVNGQGEYTYMSSSPHDSPNVEERLTYLGGHELFHSIRTDTRERWQDWTFTPGGTNFFDQFAGTPESTFGNKPRYSEKSNPAYIEDNAGTRYTYEYNEASSPTLKTYEDGSAETWDYNEFQQVTRHVDRLGRVTRSTYDTKGNLLLKEVGLLDDGSGGDIVTAEYATYAYTYYAADDFPNGAVRDLMATATDANGNVTTYKYDADRFLVEVIESDDSGSGVHTAMTSTYDPAGRLSETTDALDRTTAFAYDARDRRIETTYFDDSTELTAFGSGNDANLVVQRKDRNGNTTRLSYDNAGRVSETIVAYSVMDPDGGNEVINPVSLQLNEQCSYLAGTELEASCTLNGERTDYGYDYRNRLVSTTVHPKAGVALTTERTYRDNLLFSEEDAYGRMTYYGYRDSDNARIRTVTGTVSGFTLADFAAVHALSRDAGNNAAYLITDRLLDAEGQPVATIDPRGIAHTASYDSRGRLIQAVEAAGTAIVATTETEYDVQSNVTAVVNPRGFRTEMTYTQRNLLADSTEAAGESETATESYTYHDDGLANEYTDFNVNPTQTIWQTLLPRVQAQIDQAGHGRILNYDFYGNTTHLAVVENVLSHSGDYQDPLDATTLNEITRRFDARHRLIAETVWLAPLGPVDPDNVPIAGPGDATGLTTTYEYFDEAVDTGGSSVDARLTPVLDALAADGISFNGTDQQGSAVIVTNPEGELRVSISDGIGRTVITAVIHNITYQLLTWSTTRFDDYDNGLDLLTTQSIDALDHTVTQFTDGAGRTRFSRDAEYVDHLKESKFVFDANSNLLSFRDNNDVGQDCVFDARNRETDCTDTQGDTMGYGYDGNNNVISITDAKNVSSSFVFDARDRESDITDRINGTTRYTYDGNNNLLTITDAEGNVTRYEFDVRNLLVKTTYPDHVVGTNPGDADYGIVEMSFDAARRKASQEDQLGDEVIYHYDLANRLETRTYQELGQGADESQDSFAYDKASRLLTAEKGRYGNGVSFAYDQASRKTRESLTLEQVAQAGESRYGHRDRARLDRSQRQARQSSAVESTSYTSTSTSTSYISYYAYDYANRQISHTYPDGSVLTKGWTDRNQLEETRLDGALVASSLYDEGLRETSRTLGNGLTTTFGFNREDNLKTGITVAGKSSLSFAYDYDPNKNIVDETTTGVMAGFSFTADYDDEDRVIYWDRTNLDSQDWDLSLVGDWNSNTVNGGAPEIRTHNDVHELTDIDANALRYDPKGNMTEDKAGNTLTWDIDNHLAEMQDSGSSTLGTYEYDALGRRVSKMVGSLEIVFVSAGQQVVAEYDGGKDPAIDAPERKYVYGGGYIDAPVLMVTSAGDEFYYHQNRQFNVIGMTDSSGDVVERYAYTAYGEVTVLEADGVTERAVSAVGNPYMFTGRRLDDETGLYYFRARYYSGEQGRFVSRDPIGYVDGMSLYEYVRSNPLGYVDPSGLLADTSGTEVQTGENFNADKDKPCCLVVKDFWQERYDSKDECMSACYDQFGVGPIIRGAVTVVSVAVLAKSAKAAKAAGTVTATATATGATAGGITIASFLTTAAGGLLLYDGITYGVMCSSICETDECKKTHKPIKYWYTARGLARIFNSCGWRYRCKKTSYEQN